MFSGLLLLLLTGFFTLWWVKPFCITYIARKSYSMKMANSSRDLVIEWVKYLKYNEISFYNCTQFYSLISNGSNKFTQCKQSLCTNIVIIIGLNQGWIPTAVYIFESSLTYNYFYNITETNLYYIVFVIIFSQPKTYKLISNKIFFKRSKLNSYRIIITKVY